MSRVAIVTGAGTGIGAASARLLASKGLDVALVGRTLAIAADVGEPDAPQRIVDETLAAFSRLDVLVNNAAVIRSGPLESFTREMFDWHYDVNVAGPFFLLAAALPSLRASPDAAVVNVSSVWIFASPETAWTTGNVIHADGGEVLGLPEFAGG